MSKEDRKKKEGGACIAIFDTYTETRAAQHITTTNYKVATNQSTKETITIVIKKRTNKFRSSPNAKTKYFTHTNNNTKQI